MKVIKFAASWCGPCKMLSNVLEDYKGDMTIEEVQKVIERKNDEIRKLTSALVKAREDVEYYINER